MKIHADDCSRLNHCCGSDYKCYREDCGCHAQQALDELVAASDEALSQICGEGSYDRLQAALKPFLEKP